MQNLIPYVWQMVFANVFVKGWIINSDIQSLFYGSQEYIEYKMADFSNHRRFTLRCLSKNLIPVSARLKSTFKTPKSKEIIRKAERALLNERVRLINNSLAMFKELRDTCINNLNTILEDEKV